MAETPNNKKYKGQRSSVFDPILVSGNTPVDNSAQGHRSRMRSRILSYGAESLADYELLEVLLFYHIRRGDTKSYAKKLLKEYGSFARFIGTCAENKRVSISMRSFLDVICIVGHKMAHINETESEVWLGSWSEVLNFCKSRFSSPVSYLLHILYLNGSNVLLDYIELPFNPNRPISREISQEIVRSAVQKHAVACVIIIDLPLEEIPGFLMNELLSLVRTVQSVMAGIGLSLHDAALRSCREIRSMRRQGLIDNRVKPDDRDKCRE